MRECFSVVLFAVILAGGSGELFWPLSSRSRPKQFLRMFGERTMLQETAHRVRHLVPLERVLVVTDHAASGGTPGVRDTFIFE